MLPERADPEAFERAPVLPLLCKVSRSTGCPAPPAVSAAVALALQHPGVTRGRCWGWAEPKKHQPVCWSSCCWHLPRRNRELLRQVTGDLFDIMSGQTDVDHPLCEECTDTLLDQLDTQLNITENECQNYK